MASENITGFNIGGEDKKIDYNSLVNKPTIPTVPESLKNPNALSFNGAVTGTYDGSKPLDITIPSVDLNAKNGEGEESFISNGTEYAHAYGKYSHAEGQAKTGDLDDETKGKYAHAEGDSTTAAGDSSHAEGSSTQASGENSHAEGRGARASGESSHAEGSGAAASGKYSHAEGSAKASGESSHAEGFGGSEASGLASHSEGMGTAKGDYSHAEGFTTNSTGNYSHAEGNGTAAYGESSHAEGGYGSAFGQYSHVEGGYSVCANGNCSHAEGEYSVESCGEASHAEGRHGTYALGAVSHAEGESVIAGGDGTHVEGNNMQVFGAFAHGFGRYNTLDVSAETYSNKKTYNVGDVVFVKSSSNTQNGGYAAGIFKCTTAVTTAEDFDPSKWGRTSLDGPYVEVVGNGNSKSRSNARTLDWDGNEWLAGTVEPVGGLILKSTTANSTKRFLVTVDDSGTLKATEITA